MSDEHAQFEPAEQQAIRDAVARRGSRVCPRDGATMTSRAIGGGSFGLGYARRREWLICPTLHAESDLRSSRARGRGTRRSKLRSYPRTAYFRFGSRPFRAAVTFSTIHP